MGVTGDAPTGTAAPTLEFPGGGVPMATLDS